MLRNKNETFEKYSILFKFKEGENFNHRNTLSISRIKLKLHFVHNVETDPREIGSAFHGAGAEIGQKGAFCKGLSVVSHHPWRWCSVPAGKKGVTFLPEILGPKSNVISF